MLATVTNVVKTSELVGKKLKLGTEEKTYIVELEDVEIISIGTNATLQFVGQGKCLDDLHPKENFLKVIGIWDIEDPETNELLYEWGKWKM